ncbi:MAG TPA: hypothetical protein PLU62_08330 [Ignavibacteriales bacterium]|nr:hypothetical protein [Ignavibacteriales bacterium]
MKKTIILVILFAVISAQPRKQTQRVKVDNKKSPALAILYSFILPGLGEYYAGDYSTGKYFTIAEGMIWGSYLGMQSYARHIEANYKNYAISQANITNDKKNSDFWSNLGKYNSVYDYNNEKFIMGQYNNIYDVEKFYWNWQDVDSRIRYRSNWKSAETVKNNSKIILATLVLNRFASAINAARQVSKYNKGNLESSEYNFGVLLDQAPDNSSNINLFFQLELK